MAFSSQAAALDARVFDAAASAVWVRIRLAADSVPVQQLHLSLLATARHAMDADS